jgi:hypothetical protein
MHRAMARFPGGPAVSIRSNRGYGWRLLGSLGWAASILAEPAVAAAQELGWTIRSNLPVWRSDEPVDVAYDSVRRRAVLMTTATLQGLIEDDASRVPEGWSVTNAVIVRTE